MFRDDHPQCLGCDAALDRRGKRWICTECDSRLIAADELQDALNEVSPDDWRELDQRLIPSKALSPKRRICPRCETMMDAFSILDVPCDRCPTHGIWIDGNGELQMVLRNEEMFKARNSRVPRGALVPFGIGIIFGALLSPWLDKRRLRKDIERTSPPKKK